MSGFLDNYELANDTIKRFWVEHPTGRIMPIIVDIDLTAGWVLFKVEVYREYEDHQPSAIGHAYGNVTYYPANMRRWFIEDSETSAIARAIKLLTPSTERPSREDMQKVEALKPMPDNTDFWATNPAAAAGLVAQKSVLSGIGFSASTFCISSRLGRSALGVSSFMALAIALVSTSSTIQRFILAG